MDNNKPENNSSWQEENIWSVKIKSANSVLVHYSQKLISFAYRFVKLRIGIVLISTGMFINLLGVMNILAKLMWLESILWMQLSCRGGTLWFYKVCWRNACPKPEITAEKNPKDFRLAVCHDWQMAVSRKCSARNPRVPCLVHRITGC